MSNLSTYTSVFRANAGYRAKRNRQPVSCTSCQRRKTRCDRQQPCYACWQRHDPDNCHFGPTVSEDVQPESDNCGAAAGGVSRKEVQARLNRLEDIVKELASRNQEDSNKRQRVEDDNQCARGDGSRDSAGQGMSLQVDRTDGAYHGATSWSSLVANIRDIQHLLDSESGGSSEKIQAHPLAFTDLGRPRKPPPFPECFLRSAEAVDLKRILEALPERQHTDKLVGIFFNAKFVAVPFIHAHQFRRQYDSFWEDPSSASYLWVSILFSILAISLAVVHYSPNPMVPDSRKMASKCLTMAVRCFNAGEYLRAKPLSVEALLIHIYARHVCLDDSDPAVWTFYGLALRLAQRQGYHREMAKVSARATPFASEMRRRVWYMLRSMDLLHSCQQGMPPMVDPTLCDTQFPSNLNDEDFDEDTVILPPARGTMDPTPMLAYTIKAPLCSILDRALRQALTIGPRVYSDVLALHAELEAWHESVPACLKVRPIKSTSFTDPSYTIMHRIMLETVYLKTLCILHREYLGFETRRKAEFQTSTKSCTEAAERLIKIHIELDEEIQPGGRMFEDRYMVNSLTLHDFLIAAMILCVELSETNPRYSSSCSERKRHIEVLKSATEIWAKRSDTSQDARRATQILKAILLKVDIFSSAMTSQLETPKTTPTLSRGHSVETEPTYNAHEWQMNLGDDSIMFDPFSSDNPTLDWGSIDEFLRTGNSVDPVWATGDSDVA